MAFSPETYALLKAQGGGGGGGGSDLPSVTSSDNGKVLSVVNGAWAAAIGKGICGFNAGTLDKSYNDLMDMLDAGVLPFFISKRSATSFTIYYFAENDSAEGDFFVTFAELLGENTINLASSDPDEPMENPD